MNSPAGPTSHRAGGPSNKPSRRLLSALLAVVAVVVVIAVLLFFRSHGSTSKKDTTTTTPIGTTVATTPTPSVPASPTVGSPTPTSRPTRHHPKTTRTSTHPKPSASAVTAMAPVAVLNNSRRTGLAHYVAAEVRGKGWDIYAVGNLRGRVIESTVYYAPGDASAAAHLAREFAGVRRVLPESELGLRTTGLTLVLTEDWYG